MPTLRVKGRSNKERKVSSTHTTGRINVLITGSPTALPGRTLATEDRRKVRARPLIIPREQPRASSPINDNYSLQEGLLARTQGLPPEKTLNSVNYHVVKSVPYAPGHSQKKELSPGAAVCQISRNYKLNFCEQCFLCHSVVFCPTCSKCPQCCSKSACRGQTSNLLANLVRSGSRSEGSSDPQRGLHPPISDPAKTRKDSYSHKLLCQSPQEQLPVGGITSAYRQKCGGAGPQSNISGVFQPTIFSPKPNNKWRPILDLNKLNLFLKVEKFKMETPETIRTSLQQGEWVTSVDFKDACFHMPIQEQSMKYLRFHVQSRIYQFKALPFVMSTAPMEFTC